MSVLKLTEEERKMILRKMGVGTGREAHTTVWGARYELTWDDVDRKTLITIMKNLYGGKIINEGKPYKVDRTEITEMNGRYYIYVLLVEE